MKTSISENNLGKKCVEILTSKSYRRNIFVFNQKRYKRYSHAHLAFLFNFKTSTKAMVLNCFPV